MSTPEGMPVPPLIYDQLLAQWPEIREQLMMQQKIDPADPLIAAPTNDLTEDE